MSLRIALFALGLVVGIPAYGQPSGPQLELFGGGGCLDDVDVAALQVGPSAMRFDRQGVLYIASPGGVCLYRVNMTTGKVSHFAGTGRAGYDDGKPRRETNFQSIADVDVDVEGNVFLIEGDRMRVRRIDARTGVVTRIGGPAGLVNPQVDYWQRYRSLSADSLGNVYLLQGDCQVSRWDRTSQQVTSVFSASRCAEPSRQPIFSRILAASEGRLYVATNQVIGAGTSDSQVCELLQGNLVPLGALRAVEQLRQGPDGLIYAATSGKLYRYQSSSWIHLAGATDITLSNWGTFNTPDATAALQAPRSLCACSTSTRVAPSIL